MKPRKVIIRTGSRLHFGPLSFRPKVGPEFGGLGMMIREPGFEFTMETSTRHEIDAPPCLTGRIEKIAAAVLQKLGREDSQCLQIKASREIPHHVGLGSGTQLGLAVAKGIAVLAERDELPIQELARMAGRGRLSAIGIHGFQRGGFLVDDGKPSKDEIGNLSHRLDFPERWRIMLVIPKDQKGISGEREVSIFDRLEPMESSTSKELHAMIDSAIIPALKRNNFDAFSTALTHYGKTVGEYFSEYQGGVFAFPDSPRVCDVLDSHGVVGYGQTSWGPMLWIMQQNETQATELVETLQREPVFQNSNFQIVEPLNEGANIEYL